MRRIALVDTEEEKVERIRVAISVKITNDFALGITVMMYLDRRKVAIKYIVDQCRSLLFGSVYFLPNDLLGKVIALNENPQNNWGKN